MHTILDAKEDPLTLIVQFYTDSGYILTLTPIASGGYPNPAILWVQKNLGDDVQKDITFAIRRHFKDLPQLLVDFIDVTIA